MEWLLICVMEGNHLVGRVANLTLFLPLGGLLLVAAIFEKTGLAVACCSICLCFQLFLFKENASLPKKLFLNKER